MINIQTSILKSVLCGMLFGIGLTSVFGIIYGIGLYLELFSPDGYEFLITLIFILVFIGPFLDEIINVFMQRKTHYSIGNGELTIENKSFLNATKNVFSLDNNISINVRFEGIFCYEWIELSTLSEKILIEKTELHDKDYNKIKDILIAKGRK